MGREKFDCSRRCINFNEHLLGIVDAHLLSPDLASSAPMWHSWQGPSLKYKNKLEGRGCPISERASILPEEI